MSWRDIGPLGPLPDECPRPPVPVAIHLNEDFSARFALGADRRRAGEKYPPVQRNMGNAWERTGWSAQDELARSKGFA